MPKIAVVGSIITDLAVLTPRLPERGENILAHCLQIGPGGKGANAAVAVARLNAQSILVGRVGEAVKVRGMFVHPNQIRFAIGSFPVVARVQAVVTRPENRDELAFRVELADEDVDRDQLVLGLSEAFQAACRVRADSITLVDSGTIAREATIIVDQRKWD